jgi:hypothetical protein
VVIHGSGISLPEVAQLIYEVARHPVRYGAAEEGAPEVARVGEYLAGCAADADLHRPK